MIRTQPRILALAGLVFAGMLFSAAQPARSQTSNQASEKLQGLPNWGQVTDTLFRGGQPASAGFKALQQMGVGIVVNFRDEGGEIASEQREVESLGLKYVSIPWSGSNEPSDAQVVQFLDLVRANPTAKIFVHCKRGADRTGVMVAAYRIAVQHETVSDAVTEMHQFHYDHFWLPQLESYVKALPESLSGKPIFSAYASTSTSTSPSAPVLALPVGAAAPLAAPTAPSAQER
ncbi:MAG: tyrosine-protein phosphatase [Candidatus Acidiferrales bacterium]